MRVRRRAALASFVAASALSLSLGAGLARAQAKPVAPPPTSPDEARTRRADQAMKLHDEAHDLYERGEYRKAIEKLEQAFALDPTGKELLYNLALIHEKLGEVDAADRYYAQYLEMETDPELRERVESARRRIVAARKDLAPKVIEVVRTRPRADAPIVVQEPITMRRPVTPLVVTTGAIAATAFVASGVLAILAASKNPSSDASTGSGVSADDLEADARSAHHRAMLADVGLAVGAVATGAALVLYFSTPPRPQRAALDLSRGVRLRF